MKKNFPSKMGEFVKNNKNEILTLVEKKVELIVSILEYQKSKNELEIAKANLEVKKEEIKSNELIELERIKSSLEERKMEYESLMKNRELEHKERMEKLAIIKNQLREGNDLIKGLIKETKEKQFIDKFYEFQLEIIKALKDL